MTRLPCRRTLRAVETRCAVVRGRATAQAKGSTAMLEIVVIVLIVLFVVGYFGRGRFRA